MTTMTERAPAPPAPLPPIEDELRKIPLTDLHESPWNPRKHFNPDRLAELAESLKVKGQLTPIQVRPRKVGGYEIGAGHRRFRAAAAAGIRTLLAVVRSMEDTAFLELLVFENGERADLHPLEEADGYRLLMERAGYDVGKIAAHEGKSLKYVYDRIKLLQLIPAAKKLFLDGAFEAGHAIILARLTPEWQERAIDPDKSGNGRIGGLFYPEYFDGHPNLPAQERIKLEDAIKPVSVREFQTWVDDHVRLKPEEVDPVLFPETTTVLESAADVDEKVVHITHDYRVGDDARDEQRTYGEQAWKRADGKLKSKECDYSNIGMVVAGPGRGEAFRVCVNKKKCEVHWRDEVRSFQRREKARAEVAARAPKSSKGGSRSAPEPVDIVTDELRDTWLAEELRARVATKFLQAIKEIIGQLKMPDEIVWNLAYTDLYFYGWSKPGGPRKQRDESRHDEDLEALVVPELPGKWGSDGAGSFKDAAAARSSMAFKIWLARDTGTLDDEIDKAVALREKTYRNEHAAKAKAAKEKASAKKKAGKKGAAR